MSSSTANEKTVLPEDQELVVAKEEGISEVTWVHPNHGDMTTDPLCDVCNGKLSLEDFVAAKLARENEKSGEKRRKSSHHSRERHSSSKGRHSHSSSSKDKKHSKDRDRDKRHKHSSSSDKKHTSSSSSKSSSKSHSSSSKKDHSSSSSKSKGHRRSKSKERERHGSSKSKKVETPTTEEPTVSSNTSEIDHLQEQLNKANAAIEASMKAIASRTQDVDDSVEEIPQDDHSAPEGEGPGSPIDIDIPEASDEYDPSIVTTGADGEVSSTVRLKTY